MIEVDRSNIVINSGENFLMAILLLEQTLSTIRNILQILIDKIDKPWGYEPKIYRIKSLSGMFQICLKLKIGTFQR